MRASAFKLISVAVAAALWAAPVSAGKKDDTLRWASDSDPSNLDWYYHTLREGIVIGYHVWDPLIYKDPDSGDYVPHLAKSLTFVDPTTVEVELRQDVTFHNGEKLDADDVVYTIQWVTNPESKIVADYKVSFLRGAEKIDQYKARIFLKEPFPAAREYFASAVVIYPNEYYAKVGPTGMAQKPVGTGPYKVTEVTPGKQIVLEKNTDYFGGAKGQPSIGKLVFRRIGEFNTQVAELVTGGLDWIWRVPPDAAKKLERQKGLTVLSAETMRFGYVNMDAAGRSGQTPMTDLRVRRAVNHAINREAIRSSLIGGESRIIHVPCFPSQFGCIDKSATRYDYDPKKARALLAEAGHANGFDIDFYAYRERPVAEAIVGDLRAVGIKANLVYMQQGALLEKRRAGSVPINFGAWGSSSLNDITASVGNFFTHTGEDYSRDPEVLRLMNEGNTTDEAKRKEVYEKALARIAEQAYWVPLFSYSTFFAYTSDLDFKADEDEVPRFFRAKWK
jgi:peptide/nickel transport system substrate-binding protein